MTLKSCIGIIMRNELNSTTSSNEIMIKNKLISLALLALFCVIFWNALDFLYSALIKHGGYSFSVFNDICLPAVIGVTVGMITNLRSGQSSK